MDKPVLHDETLYIGDNGRVYCGEHSGMSARYSGRDISGQRVEAILEYPGWKITCEKLGCGRTIEN